MNGIKIKFCCLIAGLLFFANALNAAAQEISADFKGNEPEGAISALLAVARNQGGTVAQRAGAVADALSGADFKATADKDPAAGPMSVNLNAMDGIELIEYCAAAAKASLVPGAQMRDFLKELQGLRYRRGENTGFTSRLRYVCDWIADNAYRNNVREMTYDLLGNVFTSRTLDHITRNRENYPALADSATFERMQLLEMGYRVHKIPYMKRESIGKKGVIELLKDNDILIIIDKSKDNDFLDAGFIRLVEGRPYLLHASESSGKVGMDPEPLSDMMKLRAKEIAGYRVLRLKD